MDDDPRTAPELERLDRRAVSAISVVALFGSIAFLVVLDLANDYCSGARTTHMLVDLGVIAVAAAGGVAVVLELRRVRRAGSAGRLAGPSADAARWRREAEQPIRRLSSLIDQQFTHWGLTDAEREVALLLLRGLSPDEVAAIRATSEQAARADCLEVYRKAGLDGRAALSAFFLGDLLLPPRGEPPAASAR